jgi:iron complex outermembrane recepter protein
MINLPKKLAIVALGLLVAVSSAFAEETPPSQSIDGGVAAAMDGGQAGPEDTVSPSGAPEADAGPATTSSSLPVPDEVQLDEVVIGTGQKVAPAPAVVETTTAKDIERINTVSSADAFKYVPNLHVRKLQAGNINQPIALRGNTSTTAGPRTLVLVDGLQLTNYISGSMGDSPKWQMLSPDEIASFDVIYGPFSAAYGGNSFSGTVLITTRMPDRLELKASATAFLQTMHIYDTDRALPGYHVSASAGNRHGALSYLLSFDRVHGLDQPISFYNLGTAGQPTGNPVTGAVPDIDPKGQPRTMVGSQGPLESRNNTLKLKLGYDVTSWSELRLTLAFWDNHADLNDPESYLRDSAGNQVFAGPVDVGGQGYTLADNTFSYQRSHKQDLFYGLSYRINHPSGLKAWASASYYDTVKDLTQVSSSAPTAAKNGGAGTSTDKDSGSWVADAKLSYDVFLAGKHTVGGGYHYDRFDLQSEVWNTSDWLRDVRTTLSKREQGATQTHAAFLDDLWQVLPWWSVYVGGRVEWWKAFDGAKAIDAPDGRIVTTLPNASDHNISPKVATTFSPIELWSLRLSYGVANRYPTVGELFYGGITSAGIISSGNPDLKRERNQAKDITLSRVLPDGGQVRLSVFQDDVKDAIFSQTNSYTNITNYQNVDKVRTRGIELSGNVRRLPLRRLGLSGSVGLNDSEIEANSNVPASVGKQFPRVPRWRAKLGIDYATEERWLFFAGGNYASHAYYNLDNSDTRGGYGAVDSYLVLDARASFRINRFLIADGGVDNITNRQYFEFHPFPGRTFHLGVRAAY